MTEGRLFIELGDTTEQYREGKSETIELNPGQGITISKGVYHRPYAPGPTVMLMVETSAIRPTGD